MQTGHGIAEEADLDIHSRVQGIDDGLGEKQHRDALRVYELQNETLDMNYILKWVKQLGVATDWEWIVREADM